MTDPPDAKIEELVRQMKDLRKTVADLFEQDGWTAPRRDLVERLDRLIAEHEG